MRSCSKASLFYRAIHPNKNQCLVKPYGDLAKMSWNLTYSDSNCDGIHIRVSKMMPTLCLGIQLYSDLDQYYIIVNETDNFSFKLAVMPSRIRYRMILL